MFSLKKHLSEKKKTACKQSCQHLFLLYPEQIYQITQTRLVFACVFIADEKQKVCACVSAMQAFSPKIVADGLVLPLVLQRNAVATSIT